MNGFTSNAEMRRYMAHKPAATTAALSAALKLDMMGLTPENGMVECPAPEGVDSARWKAMVTNIFKNGAPK